MKTPNLDKVQFVDEKGHLTPYAHGILTQLFTNLQQNLSDEGYKLPQQGNANIISLNNTKSTGAILYNSDVHSFIGNINGVFKTFTLT